MREREGPGAKRREGEGVRGEKYPHPPRAYAVGTLSRSAGEEFLGALAILTLIASPEAIAADSPAELQDLRQQCVAIGETAQQDERALLTAQHDIALLGRDAAGIERELKDTRGEQAQLLGALARFARNPPEDFGVVAEPPLDRIRTGMLVAAAGPALGRDAQALLGEFTRLATARQLLAKKQAEAAVQHENIQKDYASIAELTARREAVEQKLVHGDAADLARLAASRDLRELIKAAATKKPSTAADAGRPKGLRVFDAAAAAMLHPPVAGAISARFGAAETDKPSNGLAFDALPGAVVAAAFDGRIDYAARFRDLGLVLIIWHGGGYHTVLAGLDRIDAKPGEWVLAGEPVGAMPDTAKAASGTVLKFELRRDGEPIDPFPSLIDSSEPTGRDGAGQNRVRE